MTTPVFTGAPNANNNGDAGFTYRSIFSSTLLLAPSQGLISVSFASTTAQIFWCDHAAIGIWDGSTLFTNTTATPVELTFAGGGHGAQVSSGIVTSDLVALAFSTSIAGLVVIIDHHTPNTSEGAISQTTTAGINLPSMTSYTGASASYNVKTFNATPVGQGRIETVLSIQTSPSNLLSAVQGLYSFQGMAATLTGPVRPGTKRGWGSGL